MKRFLTLSILVFIIGFINNVYAPNVPKKFDVRVDLVGEDESTKNLIESYIKRELRSLQDVNIMPDDKYATYLLYPINGICSARSPCLTMLTAIRKLLIKLIWY